MFAGAYIAYPQLYQQSGILPDEIVYLAVSARERIYV